jgi:hypothetical protein
MQSDLTLILTPSSTTYNVDAAMNGAVRFAAEIRNRSDRSVVVAHPSTCWPGGRAPIRDEERHGKSEILLEVRTPNGRRLVLRDGPHYFDPGGAPNLRVPPQDVRRFDIGWFFRNARGRWEDDELAATTFVTQGEYVVALVLRNTFQCILDVTKPALSDVWTGEMRSPPVTIWIK